MSNLILKARRAEPEGAKRIFGGKWYIKTSDGWKPLESKRPKKEEDLVTPKRRKEEEKKVSRTPRGKRPTRQNPRSAAIPSETPEQRERREKSKYKFAIEFLRENNISAEAAKQAFLKFKELSEPQQNRTSLSEYIVKEAIKEGDSKK